jgi:hypothetical protein
LGRTLSDQWLVQYLVDFPLVFQRRRTYLPDFRQHQTCLLVSQQHQTFQTQRPALGL